MGEAGIVLPVPMGGLLKVMDMILLQKLCERLQLYSLFMLS